MKIFTSNLVLIMICACKVNCELKIQPVETERSVLVISSFVDQFFAKESSILSFIFCSENIKYEMEIQNELLRNISISFTIENCNNLTSNTKMRNFVILIDQENTEVIQTQMTANRNRFDNSGFYLVYFLDGSNLPTAIEKLIQTFSDLFIQNVNFLIKQGDEFILTTFFPFTESSCESRKSVMINKFVDSWETSIFYPKKMKNFFKCPLKTAAFLYPPVIMMEGNYETSNYTLYGSDIELYKAFAEALNFTIVYDFDPKPGAWGILSEDGKATGGFLKIKSRQADVMLGMLSKIYTRAKFISFSSTFSLNPVMLIIPRGAPFSSFEKLFRPFEDVVWIYLLIVFLSGFILVTVLTIQPRNLMKTFLIGKEINMPALNMIVALVGGSQHILPIKSVARILLMTL